MSLLRIGPDRLFLVEAVVISAVVAVITWRHLGRTAALLTMMVAIGIALWDAAEFATPTASHRVLVASFVIVPSAVLLGSSHLRWIASRPWSLLIAGPIVFAAGYLALCYCAVELGAI